MSHFHHWSPLCVFGTAARLKLLKWELFNVTVQLETLQWLLIFLWVKTKLTYEDLWNLVAFFFCDLISIFSLLVICMQIYLPPFCFSNSKLCSRLKASALGILLISRHLGLSKMSYKTLGSQKKSFGMIQNVHGHVLSMQNGFWQEQISRTFWHESKVLWTFWRGKSVLQVFSQISPLCSLLQIYVNCSLLGSVASAVLSESVRVR